MNIQKRVTLAPYTTLKVGGPARSFVTVTTTDELKEALSFAHEKDIPVFVLGDGANIVISDEGFDGLVINMCITGIEFKNLDEEKVAVTAYAGEEWDDLVIACVENELWGIENTSGIPGTVGAAIVGNIAAYGQAVADTLHSVEVIDTTDAESGIETLAVEDLGLRYRYSDFQNEKLGTKVVISATFVLNKAQTKKLEYESALRVARELDLDPDDLEERRTIILEARRRAGSLLKGEGIIEAHTAGSFFRNPEVPAEVARQLARSEEFGVSERSILKQNLVHGGSTARVSAAHVLLAAGFERGQSWGSVRLHPQHILKIENTGGARAQDIYNVSTHIVSTAKEKLGIDLEPEVRFIGRFD